MAPQSSSRLRYAQPGDAEAVGRINHRGWQSAYRGLMPDAVLDAMDRHEIVERWRTSLSNHRHIKSNGEASPYRTVVAIATDEIVGYISVGPSRDGNPDDVGDAIGEVLAIYVDPDHQGNGIGSSLLTTGHRILRHDGFERATLWVLAGNDPSIGFYRSHGWELDGTTKTEEVDGRSIEEVRMSVDLGHAPGHVEANREEWNEQAAGYVGAGERAWAASEPYWGIFSIPDADVGAFPEVAGLDVVELGCGTGYVSAWCARAGARSVTGLDNSPEQLATAKRLQAHHGLDVSLIWGDAECLPFRDASVDVAISEYGAAIWCDPHRWIAEAGRVLRPGGTLTFLGNSVLSILAANDFEDETATNELQRPLRGLHHLRWPDTDSSEFHVSHGEMIRILRHNGFEILDLVELYAPEGATTSYTFVSPEWSTAWPCEEIWIAQKRGL